MRPFSSKRQSRATDIRFLSSAFASGRIGLSLRKGIVLDGDLLIVDLLLALDGLLLTDEHILELEGA